MSTLNGEIIVFGQHTGEDVQLRVFGDEFYARYETLDGYTVVYDTDYGGYCYALLAAGHFISSGVPIGKPLPSGLRKHLKESPDVRNAKFTQVYARHRPQETTSESSGTRTLGVDDGLLSGRKLHRGTVRGLTILVDFDDVKTTIPHTAVEEMFNGVNYTANGNFCSVNQYFKLVSSGKLNYVNTVVGPVTLSKRRSHYISNLLVEEALDLAVNQFNVNLADYDSQNEGIVDAINVLYAGNSQYSGDLWPHNATKQLQYGAVRTHYYQLTGLGSHPVDLRVGTICHENGHLLCRFPDMYDYGERDGDFEKSQGIGRYCLMGSGNHLNDRRTPAPVCGYLRELAGWVDHVVMLDRHGRFAARHGAYDTILKYATTLPNEYFIIENRSQIGLDTHLPASGLAIYHCDTLGSNEWQAGTRNNHYQCALIQADGSLDLENNRNAGDATDLFSDRAGIVFSNETMPTSRQWDGTDSGLLIADIGAAGQEIAFVVGQPQARPTVNVETFPNALIPDNDPAGLTSSLTVETTGRLTDIAVHVEIIHTWISDLTVKLVSPQGNEVTLHNRAGDDGDDIRQTYNLANTPTLADLGGAEIAGTWSLVIVDAARQDAGRLVHWRLELGYQRSSTVVSESSTPNMPIPDNDAQGIADQIKITQRGNLKNIAVNVDIEHSYIGDLRVEIVSPDNQVVRLHDKTGRFNDNIKRLYDTTSTPDLNSLIGLAIRGTWELRVRDLAAQDTGRLQSWSIMLEY